MTTQPSNILTKYLEVTNDNGSINSIDPIVDNNTLAERPV
jgi:hypothetical protein